MTSEGTDALILAFTSKSGAICSALHTPNFFIWIFQSERGYIYAFYKPNFKRQTKCSRERTKQRGILAFFNRFLARLNQHRCPATLIYGTTFPDSTKTHSTSPAGWSLSSVFVLSHLRQNSPENIRGQENGMIPVTQLSESMNAKQSTVKCSTAK